MDASTTASGEECFKIQGLGFRYTSRVGFRLLGFGFKAQGVRSVSSGIAVQGLHGPLVGLLQWEPLYVNLGPKQEALF